MTASDNHNRNHNRVAGIIPVRIRTDAEGGWRAWPDDPAAKTAVIDVMLRQYPTAKLIEIRNGSVADWHTADRAWIGHVALAAIDHKQAVMAETASAKFRNMNFREPEISQHTAVSKLLTGYGFTVVRDFISACAADEKANRAEAKRAASKIAAEIDDVIVAYLVARES